MSSWDKSRRLVTVVDMHMSQLSNRWVAMDSELNFSCLSSWRREERREQNCSSFRWVKVQPFLISYSPKRLLWGIMVWGPIGLTLLFVRSTRTSFFMLPAGMCSSQGSLWISSVPSLSETGSIGITHSTHNIDFQTIWKKKPSGFQTHIDILQQAFFPLTTTSARGLIFINFTYICPNCYWWSFWVFLVSRII